LSLTNYFIVDGIVKHLALFVSTYFQPNSMNRWNSPVGKTMREWNSLSCEWTVNVYVMFVGWE